MVSEQVGFTRAYRIVVLILYHPARRAKAKLQDGKARAGSTETLPETPPELSTGFGLELYSLIHEDERKRRVFA
jgi:hypothetical protein